MGLKKYFKKRTDKADLLLKKKPGAFSPSDFHQLRVEIKKINALFKFIEFSEKDFKRKIVFKPYKTVFARAGKIRELQQEESAFKDHFGREKFIRYQKELKRSELFNKRIFFKVLSTELKKDLKRAHKKALSFLEKIKQKDLSEYLEKKEKKIKNITSQKKLKQEEIHKLRKELKIFYYNSKILKKRSKSSLVKLEKLQELLGKWHDGIVMSDHLKKAEKYNKQNSTEIKQLKKVRIQIYNETKGLFKKINKTASLNYI